jgi:hypothetical protein
MLYRPNIDMSTRELIDTEVASNDLDENSKFNGAELSESVLGRDWNSPEEDAAWSNL